MRIAGGTILRRYMHNLEKNMNQKNIAENQMYSSRRFNRASENPIDAARALRVRKAIRDIEIYQDNLNTAKMIYENAESSVMKVSAIIQSSYEALIYGAHGSVNKDDASIIADTLDRYAEEMVQLMNIVVADRKIFGGTNNTDLAFKIEASSGGNIVYYHGIPVDQYQHYSLFPHSGVSYTDIGIGMTLGADGRIDPQSAIPVTFNGAEITGCGLDNSTTWLNLDAMINLAAANEAKTPPESTTYSLDISIGADKKTVTFTVPALTPSATVQELRESLANEINLQIISAFNNPYLTINADSGLVENMIAGKPRVTITNTPLNAGDPGFPQAGITTAPSGFSSNIIQLVSDAARALKADDRLLAAQYADALFELQTNISLTIAKIGNTQEFIDFNLERTTNNLMSLLEQQRDLEAAKPEEQLTIIEVWKALFNAQLQMGANLIPMSIFNFIN